MYIYITYDHLPPDVRRLNFAHLGHQPPLERRKRPLRSRRLGFVIHEAGGVLVELKQTTGENVYVREGRILIMIFVLFLRESDHFDPDASDSSFTKLAECLFS